MEIPFKKTYYDSRETACIRDALYSGTDYISKAKALLAEQYGTPNIFLTASGSAAIDLLFCALALEQGSEIIMPSFTFPSCANTAIRAGLKIVFADIDIHTKVLDMDDVLRKTSSKTRYIATMHYGGCSLDMDRLQSCTEGVLLFEDAALSYGARYKGRPLGSIGDMGIVSFHHTKNISSGEGGMLIVHEKHGDLLEKLQTLYDNGTDRYDYSAGNVGAYTWQAAGMNAAMSNIQAALLFAQLNKSEEILDKQKAIYEYYQNALSDLSKEFGFSLPHIPEYNQNNCHVYYLMFENNQAREMVREHMNRSGIGAYIHYMPLHSSGMGKKLGYKAIDLPVTQSVSERILRLPIYADMQTADCGRIVSVLKEALCKK